ncbi:hypothetical protein GCM10022207_51010 [Streptomyces lannensis]|uniref:Uncharacterized protein n=1 Tax=Streptomyces lannensis TaxID=766498 RepID=A0ABP7KK19_9ACTN
MVDEVKSWFISPAADEDVPLTADASVADAWGPCECGSGMVFLKAPTLSDVRQEFGKRWSGSDPDYFKPRHPTFTAEGPSSKMPGSNSYADSAS